MIDNSPKGAGRVHVMKVQTPPRKLYARAADRRDGVISGTTGRLASQRLPQGDGYAKRDQDLAQKRRGAKQNSVKLRHTRTRSGTNTKTWEAILLIQQHRTRCSGFLLELAKRQRVYIHME
jgi:hypothetical protein